MQFTTEDTEYHRGVTGRCDRNFPLVTGIFLCAEITIHFIYILNPIHFILYL